jgi:hypothetical protein
MRDVHRALTIGLAAALVAGCAQSYTSPSIVPATSRMLAEAKSEDLLYVADAGLNQVDVYSYPKGEQVGTLTGFDGLAFLCTDKAGDVFVPNYDQREILEYAHGGTSPTATLDDPYSYPYSCSVDPATGNLAVVNYQTTSGAGDIAVYSHARGQPRIYKPYVANYYYFCAYDDKSDLFVEGDASGSQGTYFAFAELVKGNKSFSNVTLEDVPAFPTGLQWDGKYLAIGTGTIAGPSSGDTYIYHVQIVEGAGKTIGTTHLVERGPTSNFFIEGSTIVATGGKPPSHTKFFNYPAGGSQTKTLTEDTPSGVAVSLANQ